MTESLGFLISDVARLMRRRFDEKAQAIGATRAQWRTLSAVNRNEGINQGGLAELLEIEPITACRMIDRLEELGLVERRRDPSDRRAWRIFLTEKAHPKIEKLHLFGDQMVEQALAGLPPADRDKLSASLEAIRMNLNTPEYDETAHG